MTEEEWLACDRPDDMLDAVRDRISDRKLLLYACGCCRQAESAATAFVQTADLLEHILDKRTSGGKVSIFDAITQVLPGTVAATIAQSLSLTSQGSWMLARQVGTMCRSVIVRNESGEVIGQFVEAVHPGHAALIRELLGDPRRPVAFDTNWRTEAVIGVATGIEAERAWDRMPILADALQDAGCEESRVLDHCRGEAIHVRGCWVLDLCLGHVL